MIYSKAILREDIGNIQEREYFDMKITEQDINEAKNEARAEGRAEGRVEGFLKALTELVRDGILSVSDAAKRANMSSVEFEKLAGLTT